MTTFLLNITIIVFFLSNVLLVENVKVTAKKLSPKPPQSQHQPENNYYESLVLGGGGVRGAIYPGALTALHEAGLLQNIKSFAGTSAGSGTASFLAIGLSACDIRTVLAETSLKDVVDYSIYTYSH